MYFEFIPRAFLEIMDKVRQECHHNYFVIFRKFYCLNIYIIFIIMKYDKSRSSFGITKIFSQCSIFLLKKVCGHSPALMSKSKPFVWGCCKHELFVILPWKTNMLNRIIWCTNKSVTSLPSSADDMWEICFHQDFLLYWVVPSIISFSNPYSPSEIRNVFRRDNIFANKI